MEASFHENEEGKNAAKQHKMLIYRKFVVVELTFEMREMNGVSMEERKQVLGKLVFVSIWKGDMMY
jgi:hypothetical protein